jgi:tRNA(adenine34) deaminase
MADIVTRVLGSQWALRSSLEQSASDHADVKMMTRCLELATTATLAGEFPFAAVIIRDDELVAATTNRVARDADVTRHAELIAICQAQKALGRGNLQGCTLYTIVEPCPMCSFAIRETGIGRVVFALKSPLMGGASRWNVLGDEVLSSHMPEVFAPPPKILAGLLGKEAARVWRRWNPIFWGIIRLRGVFRP